MKEKKNFYSKIMLFGEYGVICDSMGLSIPFETYQGSWDFLTEKKGQHYQPDAQLTAFYEYLSGLDSSKKLLTQFDLEKFRNDIQNGLVFQSTIPQGFGIGSSGALCAAFYDRYAVNKIEVNENSDNLSGLKQVFAQMESFFHGISSGLDPLNCYLKKPLLIKNKDLVHFADLPVNYLDGDIHIFLINTGKPGKTGPLVNLFFDKLRHHSFYKKFRNEFIPLNNDSIKAFLHGDGKAFYQSVKELSKFTLKHFEPMIPEPFRPIWKKGLDTSLYFLKLCGSGGGGFLLGFTAEPEKVKKHFAEKNIEFIPIAK